MLNPRVEPIFGVIWTLIDGLDYAALVEVFRTDECLIDIVIINIQYAY